MYLFSGSNKYAITGLYSYIIILSSSNRYISLIFDEIQGFFFHVICVMQLLMPVFEFGNIGKLFSMLCAIMWFRKSLLDRTCWHTVHTINSSLPIFELLFGFAPFEVIYAENENKKNTLESVLRLPPFWFSITSIKSEVNVTNHQFIHKTSRKLEVLATLSKAEQKPRQDFDS